MNDQRTNDHHICAICMEDMTHRKPRMLPCVHSYCTECLEKLLTQPSNLKKSVIECPVCRKSLKLPSQGVTTLPINFLLAQTEPNDLEERERKCSICVSKRNATVRCQQCQRDLCGSCLKKHNTIKGHQEHTLRSVKGNICLEHKEAIQYVCNPCNLELCSSCIYSDTHSDHLSKISTIEDKCREIKNQISEKSEDMQNHLKHKLAHLNEVCTQSESIREEITIQAEKMLQKMRKEVEKSKESLIKKLEREEVDNKKLSVSIQNKIEKIGKAAEVCKEERCDSDFYYILKCLDVSVELDVEEAKQICRSQMSAPTFHTDDDLSFSFGKLGHKNEKLDIYPEPKYCKDEEDPYSLDKISVCTDTIYELFLSGRRDVKTTNNTNTKKKPPVKQKPITDLKKYPETAYKSTIGLPANVRPSLKQKCTSYGEKASDRSQNTLLSRNQEDQPHNIDLPDLTLLPKRTATYNSANLSQMIEYQNIMLPPDEIATQIPASEERWSQPPRTAPARPPRRKVNTEIPLSDDEDDYCEAI